MIVLTINAFMKLPEKERFETLRNIAKGTVKLLDLEQLAIDCGVLECKES